MNTRIREFIRSRGPGLLILLLVLLGFVAFKFSQEGLNISEPEYDSVDSHRNRAKGTVNHVYDGDTIKVRLNNGKEVVIRILGIDCPETTVNDKCQRDEKRGWLSCEEQIPLGKRAKKRAKDRLLNEKIVLRSGTDEGFKKDPYGRRLAYVHTAEGRDFGLAMVKKGYCKDFSNAFEHPRMKRYRNKKYRETSSGIKPLEHQ